MALRGGWLEIGLVCLVAACGRSHEDTQPSRHVSSAGAGHSASGGAEVGAAGSGDEAGSGGSLSAGHGGIGGGTAGAGTSGAVGGTGAGGGVGLGGTGAGGGVGLGGMGGSAGAANEPLAPLGTSDAAIDAASGEELLGLARDIGYAVGTALCRCSWPAPEGPTPEQLQTCAVAESGHPELFDPHTSRCILEGSREVPGFDEYLRCITKNARDTGIAWAGCQLGVPMMQHPLPDCEEPSRALELLYGGACDGAFVCADDRLVLQGRCNLKLDCSDKADEVGCGEFACGEVLLDPASVCATGAGCPRLVADGFCDPEDPYRFVCSDGTRIDSWLVCSGTEECADGADEAQCL